VTLILSFASHLQLCGGGGGSYQRECPYIYTYTEHCSIILMKVTKYLNRARTVNLPFDSTV